MKLGGGRPQGANRPYLFKIYRLVGSVVPTDRKKIYRLEIDEN